MEDSAELYNNLYIDLERIQNIVRQLVGQGGNLPQIYMAAENSINRLLRFLRTEISYDEYLNAQPIDDRLTSILNQLRVANQNSPGGLRSLVQGLEQLKNFLVNNYGVTVLGPLN